MSSNIRTNQENDYTRHGNVQEIDKWISEWYNQTNGPTKNRRFGLATWVLGWGLSKTYSTIKHIKDSVRILQEQNLLQ